MKARRAKLKKKDQITPACSTRTPGVDERSSIAAATKRVKERKRRFSLQLQKTKSGSSQIHPSHTDEVGWSMHLLDVFGTCELPFAIQELVQLRSAATTSDGDINERTLNAYLAIVDGCRPRNELEALLASQAAVTHGLAMECLQRAKNADMAPQFEMGGNMAVRLMRAFGNHVELLKKLQRGTDQRVVVEHVHVHSGGQAIVGNVATGGRANEKFDHQPHAPEETRSIEASGGAPMRCEEPEREPVPVPGSERKEALPNARRRKR